MKNDIAKLVRLVVIGQYQREFWLLESKENHLILALFRYMHQLQIAQM